MRPGLGSAGCAAALAMSAFGQPAPAPDVCDSYIKVEVRGRLELSQQYRFAAELDRSPQARTGAVIMGVPLLLNFELHAQDRRQFDLIKAAHGKSAVVGGQLDVVPILEDVPFSSPPHKRLVGYRHIIRVREVKLVEPKEAAPPKK